MVQRIQISFNLPSRGLSHGSRPASEAQAVPVLLRRPVTAWATYGLGSARHHGYGRATKSYDTYCVMDHREVTQR